MKIIVRLFSFLLIIVLLSGCKSNRNSSGVKNAAKSKPFENIKIEGDTLSVSPGRTGILIQVKNESGKALWIINKEKTLSKKISTIGDDYDVKSVEWSRDGSYLAFVVYNMEGHSPLTSSRVWISNNTGVDVREVTLDSPNQRFSTFDPKWVSGNLLIIRAMTLTSPVGQKYLYNLESEKIKNLDSK